MFLVLLIKPVNPARRDGSNEGVRVWGNLVMQLELYRTHVGTYPPSLENLVHRPTDPASAEKWRGPYIIDLGGFYDAWGRQLRYVRKGTGNSDRYALWGLGRDGIDGTRDDIHISG